MEFRLADGREPGVLDVATLVTADGMGHREPAVMVERELNSGLVVSKDTYAEEGQ